MDDHGIGLYDHLARFYDPWWGPGYVSVDPLADVFAEWSPYQYAFRNPMRFVDKTGMAPTDTTGTDTQAQKITDAAENAVDHVEELDSEHGKVNRCNQGVACAVAELTGSDELGDKNKHIQANDQLKILEESENYEPTTMDEAQELANNGEVVIAAESSNSGSGHISLVVPSGEGDNTYSGTLKKDVPLVMNTGKPRTAKQKISESFSISSLKAGNVKFFKFVDNKTYVGPQRILEPVVVTSTRIDVRKGIK